MITYIILIVIIAMGIIEELVCKNLEENRGILYGCFTVSRGIYIIIKGVCNVVKNIVAYMATKKGE